MSDLKSNSTPNRPQNAVTASMAKARQQDLQQRITKQTGDYTRFKKSNEERMVERERNGWPV